MDLYSIKCILIREAEFWDGHIPKTQCEDREEGSRAQPSILQKNEKHAIGNWKKGYPCVIGT